MSEAGQYPAADWRPIPVNYSPGGNTPRLLIVHMMQGTLDGTEEWFRDPASTVSAHFGVGRDGTVRQWVATDDIAWHAVAANPYSIGVEHEGYSGEPLTHKQLDATALLFRWVHETYPAVSRWLNTRPDDGSGLSWHGLGGRAWGNHLDCPGAPVVHQLRDILAISEAAAG